MLNLGSIKNIYLVDLPELIMQKAVRVCIENIFDMKCKIQSAFSAPPPPWWRTTQYHTMRQTQRVLLRTKITAF